MCDCYWEKCEVCKRISVPVHIADFCIPRDDIRIYCKKHIPEKDIVVHKLIENEYYHINEIFSKKPKRRRIEHIAGWKMGVRYIKDPPYEYGYTTVTPNVGQEHIAKVIPKSKKPYWITEWTNKNHTTEIEAVKETIKNMRYFSPSQQVWRRYLLKLEGKKTLRKLNVSVDIRKEIKTISEKLRKRYKDSLGIVLIGSFAEGNYEKDSDIDMVFVKKKKIRYMDLYNITKNTEGLAEGKIRIQIIPYKRKDIDEHFRNSTTMAYAIQRGRIIYQKKDFLERYYKLPLGWPNGEWLKEWFKHWERIYSFGVEDFKKNKNRKIDYVTDCLSRGVVNFGILFLETRGSILTTKKNLQECFCKEIQDEEIKEGFKIAIKSHHEDRNISVNEAEKVYITGEFIKKEMDKYFRELEERKKTMGKV